MVTMTRKSPMPTTGPMATKVTANAAGKKIPKPLIPIMCLAAAITEATTGRSSKRTMVLAGTPASTAERIAYLIGFNGQTGPNFCSSSSFSKGPRVSSVFWVISGLAVASGAAVGVALALAVGVGVGVFANKETGFIKKPPKTNKNIRKSLRMG